MNTPALILGGALIIASLLTFGRYEAINDAGYRLYVMDRLTGSLTHCYDETCEKVQYE
jgi:hypothetical protein